MAIKVLYFSRTGNSRRIAEKLSSGLNCGIIQITDDKNWNGIIGFIRGGYNARLWKKTEVTLIPDSEIKTDDEIILVSPVWAANIVPAAYTLIMNGKIKPENINVLISNLGSPVEKIFNKIESRFGKFKKMYSISKSSKNEDDVIKSIITEKSSGK